MRTLVVLIPKDKTMANEWTNAAKDDTKATHLLQLLLLLVHIGLSAKMTLASKLLDKDELDAVIKIFSDEAVEITRPLALQEGLLVGISLGAAIIKIRKRLDNAGKLVSAVYPSLGEEFQKHDDANSGSKEGRELLEECLQITEKVKGRDHSSLVTHYQIFLQSRDFVTAENACGTSPMLNHAVTLYHLKRDTAVEELALGALHISEKAFGKANILVSFSLSLVYGISIAAIGMLRIIATGLAIRAFVGGIKAAAEYKASDIVYHLHLVAPKLMQCGIQSGSHVDSGGHVGHCKGNLDV